MTPAVLLAIGSTISATGLAMIAAWRGFTINRLSVFGIEFNLPNPLVVNPFPRARCPGFCLLCAGALTFGLGTYHSLSPKIWPTRFDDLQTARLRLFDVDDIMIAKVNGHEVARSEYDHPTEWINVLDKLHKGMNTVAVIIQNGTYGGCGGSLELSLNDMENVDFKWTWFEQNNQPSDIVCFERTRTVDLE